MGYINKAFLQKQFENFAARITSVFAKNTDIPNKISQLENDIYGTCATAADVAEKEVTIAGSENWELKTGSEVVVKFYYTNTAQNPTLNVNGTGAKSILYNTAVITTSSLQYAGYAGKYIRYIYDGTQYVFIGWSVDANSTYTPAGLGGGYGTCSTAAATAAKVATLSGYALVTGGSVSIKFANDVPAGATLNINSKGARAIYYRGAAITAGVIKAGDIATFRLSGQYHLLGVDRDNNTTYSVMTGATASVAGKSGLVPVPPKGDDVTIRYLCADGNWRYANYVPLINNFLTTEAGLGAADAKTVADLYSQNSSFAQSLTWKQICNAVAPSNVPNLNNYDAKEFLIIINDGFYNYVRIKPSIKVTNHERIYANGTDTYMQFIFNLWAGTGPTQINITAMVKDGVTLDPGTNAKVTVYYR